MKCIPVECSDEFLQSPVHYLQEEPLPNPETLRNYKILEELVKTNMDAYTIWNITHKYRTFNLGMTKDICMWDLQRKREVLPMYLLNITFNDTELFLEDYTYREFKSYSGNELKYARLLHKNRTIVSRDMDKYFTISKHVSNFKKKADENKELICISSSVCGCVQSSYFETFDVELDMFNSHTKHLWEFIMFGNYVDPIFRGISMLVGLILNGVLLYIFYKEDSVQTESNILILNMTVSNIIMLVFYIPVNYVGTYHLQDFGDDSTRPIIAVQILVLSANALTILFLNIQRYYDICRVLEPDNVKCKMTSKSRRVAYLTALWLWCILVALLFGSLHPYAAQTLQVILYFLVYVLAFSIILAVFNSMSARKLQQAAKRGNNVTDLKQVAGSGMILSLTATFYVTHMQIFILISYESLIDWMYMDFYNYTITRAVIFTLHVIFLLYPCINVLVLHKSCGTYRCLLNAYLFRCWYDPQERQYLTMVSVQSGDSRE